MSKFLEKVKSKKTQLIAVGTVASSLLTTVVAHAEDTTGLAGAQTQVVADLSSGKTEIIAFLLGVLGVGTGIYLFKFGVKQGFNFFGMLANKK